MKKTLLLTLLLSLCLLGVATAEEKGHGGGHSGGHGGAPHWGYQGEVGPAHWGDLSADFHACKEGRSQSPIDIVGAVDKDLPALQFDYDETTLDLINNGHTIKVNYESGSSLTVAGKSYKLLQFHFHSLSENKVDGKYFPLEAHLVHQAADGSLAVVSVLFKVGKANPLLQQLWAVAPSKANSTGTAPFTDVNVSDLLPASKDYYSFTGSLTTPPCTEGVKWMVMQQPMTISKAQIAKYRSFFGGQDTMRPVQPLNGRVVYK